MRMRGKKIKGLNNDPFLAVPLKPENIEMKKDSAGRLHLRLRLELKGLKKRIASWMGYDYSRKVSLDEYGTLYYSLVDGVRSLEAIVEQMTPALKKSRKEVEEKVVIFTKQLMTRNMILLKVVKEG
jgi:hypothetical protein